MSAAKITISIEEQLLRKLDQWIHGNSFRSRSQAIQVAIQEQVDRLEQTRLARECIKQPSTERRGICSKLLKGEGSTDALWTKVNLLMVSPTDND